MQISFPRTLKKYKTQQLIANAMRLIHVHRFVVQSERRIWRTLSMHIRGIFIRPFAGKSPLVAVIILPTEKKIEATTTTWKMQNRSDVQQDKAHTSDYCFNNFSHESFLANCSRDLRMWTRIENCEARIGFDNSLGTSTAVSAVNGIFLFWNVYCQITEFGR